MKRISSILLALVLVVSLALVTATSVLAQPLCYLGISSTAGGSVTTPGEGAFYYNAGTVVNLVATPASGYQFDCWTAIAGSFGNPNAAATTFTMPAQNTTITAHFEVVTYYYLIISSTAGGSVTTPYVGNWTYPAGTVVNLVATPASGYQFDCWSGDVTTIDNVNAASTTITMNGDYSITANFEYKLYLECLVSPNPTKVGQVTNFLAAASAGVPPYSWSWTVNGTEVATSQNTTYTFTIAGNYNVCVNVTDSLGDWKRCCSSVTVNPAPSEEYHLTISSTAGGSVTTPGEGIFSYAAGTVVSLVASPAAGCQFVNWSASAGIFANPNAAVTTFTMPAQNATVTANFEQIPVTYYTLTMAVNGSGSTSPSVGQHTYVAGTVVPISATPTSGYRFVNWTGDVGTIFDVNDPTTTITMNGHYSITANFEVPLTLHCFVSPNATEVGHETCFTASASGGVPPYSWSWMIDGTEVATVGNATHVFPTAGNYTVCVTVTDSLDNEECCCSSVTVYPAPSEEYHLTISSTTGGSVTTPGEGSFTYDEGTAVNLSASPDVGYYFVNWDGDVGTIADVNAATTGITMQGDYEITARFLADAVDAKTETVTGGGTVDATEEADTQVAVNGTATVTVARYEDNPGGDAPSDFNALGKYIDVYVPDTSQVTELEIRLYYTDAEVAAANVSEESLQLFWWDGDDWVACSDSGVNTDSTSGYSGYMWAKIRNDTTPALDQLQGTEWGGYGHPSEPPQPLCFVASAAYGTDKAKEIDILREFRDAVLLPNSLGAKLVSLYYRTSPPIANFISQHEVLRTVVRVGFVDPIVKILNWSHDLWSARGSQ